MPQLSHDLTPEQQAAVEHHEGPLLVLAGPGSGKTRVITHRIARLVEHGVAPDEILAMTFTNKAAREMAERVERLLPGARVHVSTFHRFCARLLRRFSSGVGLGPNYTILDQSGQVQLIRRLVRDEDLSAAFYDPSRIANRISRAKNDLISAEEMERQAAERIGDPMDQAVVRIYPRYQQALLQTNCVDFDDLLLHVVRLLNESEALRDQLDEQFRFTLVDEYQDTNLAQYRIVSALSQTHPNLCVTGDPDQSIYGWRGARADNILRFQDDFRTSEVVQLNQNFRSTRAIVRSADKLISHNRHRPPRSLTTDNPEGEDVELLCFSQGEQEARGIAERIRGAVERGERTWSDFAIFYRVNALSRQFEEAFRRARIPFQIAAGFAFYDRAEIRDLMAWLRVVENPDDDVALLRAVAAPTRGIGKKTLQALQDFASGRGISLHAAAERRHDVQALGTRARRALKDFLHLLEELRDAAARQSIDGLLSLILDRTGYGAGLDGSTDERDLQRQANIDELIAAARDFTEQGLDDTSLTAFLEAASLVNDVDSLSDEAGHVTLMTLHAAKGLEFPVVYVSGVEHNLIPHERAERQGTATDLEEERRLLFVGMTRAREELYLTQAFDRSLHGVRRATIRSMFLDEIPLTTRDCTGSATGPQASPAAKRVRAKRGPIVSRC